MWTGGKSWRWFPNDSYLRTSVADMCFSVLFQWHYTCVSTAAVYLWDVGVGNAELDITFSRSQETEKNSSHELILLACFWRNEIQTFTNHYYTEDFNQPKMMFWCRLFSCLDSSLNLRLILVKKINKSQSHEKKSVQDDGTEVFRCQRDAEFDHGQSNSWWFRWQSVCLQCGRPSFDLWVRKILSRRKWQPTPVPLPGKSHGQRSLVSYYNPWGCKGSDTTEQLHFNFHNQINLLKPPHLSEAVRWWNEITHKRWVVY